MVDRFAAEAILAILLEAHSAVYIEIAKVASSSLKVAFAKLLGLDLTAVDGDPHRLDFPSPGAADLNAPRLFPRHWTFSFVRNPWDRLVSCYRDKIGGEVTDFTGMSERGVAHCLDGYEAFTAGMSFEEFVDAVARIPDEDADEHFRSQHWCLTNAAGDLAVDFVGRYESLASDFEHVAKRIGLPSGISLTRLQANPFPSPYVEFYDARTRDLVKHRYARDIDSFDYRYGD